MSSTRSRSCKRKVKSRKSATKSRRPRAKSLGSPKTKRRWFGIDLKHFGVTVSKSNAFLSYLDISNDATQPNKNANNNLDILHQIWNCLFHCRKIPVKICIFGTKGHPHSNPIEHSSQSQIHKGRR
eukprot:252257_1